MRTLKTILIVLLAWGMMASITFAYPEQYPPHSFSDGPFKRVFLRHIASSDKSASYLSDDGKLSVKVEADLFRMTISDSGLEVYEYEDFGSYAPPPLDVYSGDLDANGLKDLIVIEHSTQMGSFLEGASTTILLKAAEREYRSISFESTFPGPEDFVDLDSDGGSEVIIPGFLNGTDAGFKHNYFTYSVYELRDFRLVNADAKHPGFPKFVLFSDGPNDKDTITLAPAIRRAVMEAKERSISYGTIKFPL